MVGMGIKVPSQNFKAKTITLRKIANTLGEQNCGGGKRQDMALYVRATWVVTFSDKDNHILVQTVVVYDSLDGMEQVLQWV